MKTLVEKLAEHEYRDHIVFRELAKTESNEHFRKVLTDLAEKEKADFERWLELSPRKEFTANMLDVWLAKFFRSLFGVTFIARYMQRREHRTVQELEALIANAPTELRDRIKASIDHERANEAELIGEIKEEKVEFLSSIILGLNDGLIELTGALVGFSFALQGSTLVALTGSITGIAASLSMASSAYMQAKHDEGGKDPKKAALYTGIAYFIVVVLLITPFLLMKTVMLGLIVMFVIILLIISGISYFTAVIFERSFKTQFGQMLFFSVGVSCVAFLIGLLFRRFTGVSV